MPHSTTCRRQQQTVLLLNSCTLRLSSVCASQLRADSQVLNLLDPKVKVAAFAKRWSQAVKHKDRDQQTDLIVTGMCAKCVNTGRYVVAPKLDGRISRLGQEEEQQQEQE